MYCKYGSSGCNAEISDFARRQDIRKGCAYAAISLVGYAISGILNDYDGIIVKVSRYGLEMIVSIAGVLMVYFLITGFEKRFKTLKKIKIFNTLSRDSFGIYLFHQQIIYLTIIFLNGNLYPFVQTIVSMAVALCIAETIVLLLRSWKITKMLFGL